MNKRASVRNQSPESTPIPVPVPDQLTIRFIRMAPSEEVVYFARRCAHRCAISGPLTIAVEASAGAGAGANGGEPAHAVYEVRIEQQGRPVVSERDPEILLAVRNAFDRLAISYVEVPAAHVIAPGNSPDSGPKYWS